MGQRISLLNRSPIINKPSVLLDKEQNQLLYSLLGDRCTTLSTSVVKLMIPKQYSLEWGTRFNVVVCFVKDRPQKSYSIRLYDLAKRELFWELDIKKQFSYRRENPLFHRFRIDGSFNCLKFTDEEESDTFGQLIVETLEKKVRKFEEIVKLSEKSINSGKETIISNIFFENLNKNIIKKPTNNIKKLASDLNRRIKTIDKQFNKFFKSKPKLSEEMKDNEIEKTDQSVKPKVRPIAESSMPHITAPPVSALPMPPEEWLEKKGSIVSDMIKKIRNYQ